MRRTFVNHQFQFDALPAAWPLLLQGTWITVQLSLTATLLGMTVACVWGKTDGPAPLRWAIDAYTEVIRNTPFLMQLYFFALPVAALRRSHADAAPSAPLPERP